MHGMTEYCSRGIVPVKSRSSTSVFSLVTCKGLIIIKMVLYCSEKGRWHWRGLYQLSHVLSHISGPWPLWPLDQGAFIGWKPHRLHQYSFGLSNFFYTLNLLLNLKSTKSVRKVRPFDTYCWQTVKRMNSQNMLKFDIKKWIKGTHLFVLFGLTAQLTLRPWLSVMFCFINTELPYHRIHWILVLKLDLSILDI